MKTMITSMNEKLFESYGEKFITSWSNNADAETKLIVSFEGEASPKIKSLQSENIEIISINSDLFKLFHNKFGKFSESKGFIFSKNKKMPGVASFSYNYRYDAIRFSFKVFSIYKCLELGLIKNNFAWIDSDIVCLKKFSSSDLNEFFPEKDQLASYLGRDTFPKPNPYSECGFIGYNFSHPQVFEFIEEMLRYYLSGDIFLLNEWHDSYVFDTCRRNFEQKQIEFKNISIDFMNEEHPFMKTNLRHFFDHLKGPERKAIGHS